MDKEDERRFWLGLVLALLLARAVRAFFSTLFYESLATFRLNQSAFWMLVLLAPALAPLLRGRALTLVVAAGGASTAALVVSRFTAWHVPLAALATASTLTALVSTGAFAGALAGLALDGALLALGHSVEPSSLLVPLAFAAAALLLARRVAPPSPPTTPGWVGGAAAAALLAVELAFLANPYAAGRWLGMPAWVAAAAGGLGIVVGATRLRRAGRWIWIVGALALVDVALARSPFAPVSLALVQAALGSAAARLAPFVASWSGSLAFAAAMAPLSFTLLYFRSPLGIGEWSTLVPLLVALAAAPALFEPRPPRARARVGATTAAVLLAASAVAAALPAPIDPPSTDRLTVVAWNVHQAFGNRGALDPEIYAEVLRDIDADIILLQESDTARLSSGHVDIVQYLARELDMRAGFGQSGAAILSRHPFTDDPRPPDDDWTFEMGVDVDGTTVWVRSVHLSIGRLGNRSAQVQELLDDPHAAPHIIGGDLNLCAFCIGFQGTVPTGVNADYSALTARYEDAWVAAGHAIDDPAGVTFRLPNPSRRFDHILVEGLDTLDAYVVHDERTRMASDHLPVVATFRLLEAP